MADVTIRERCTEGIAASRRNEDDRSFPIIDNASLSVAELRL